jgi:hypothetical protein
MLCIPKPKFSLVVAPEKTHLVSCGRWIAVAGRLPGVPARVGTDPQRPPHGVRVPVAKSLATFLARVKADLAAPQHDRPRDQQRPLTQQLQGIYRYFGLWHGYPKLKPVQRRVEWHGVRRLNRRSQRGRRAAESWRAQPWCRLPAPGLLNPMGESGG